MTFCWRLERSQAFAAEQEASALQYEVRAEVRATLVRVYKDLGF